MTHDYKCRSPVCLLIYRRPDMTERVLARIRAAQPQRLYVVADAPPAQAPPGLVAACERARAAVESVDWECDVQRLYAHRHLGLGLRVSSGISEIFENTESIIVLEDDCIPEPSFFRFCDELLERYRADTRVMHISGNRFSPEQKSDASYYFSMFPHCWGWATWGRAWRLYDHSMGDWPAFRDEGWLADMIRDEPTSQYWSRKFDSVFRNELDSWAYRWTFACWINQGLSILPQVNLVSNIGFGADATHTTQQTWAAGLPTEEIAFPLRHPRHFLRDERADAWTHRHKFVGQPVRHSLRSRLAGRLRRALRYSVGRFLPS